MNEPIKIQAKVQDLEALNKQLMQDLYQARLLNQTLARMLQEATQEVSPNGQTQIPQEEEKEVVEG